MSDNDPESQFGTPCTLRSDGYCLRCLDCFACPYMQAELNKHPPETKLWACSRCTGHLARVAKLQGVELLLTGHYTEGICGFPQCGRSSILLQLILGPLNHLL